MIGKTIGKTVGKTRVRRRGRGARRGAFWVSGESCGLVPAVVGIGDSSRDTGFVGLGRRLQGLGRGRLRFFAEKGGWPTCVKYWLQFIDSGLVSWWSHGVLGALLCTYCAPLASAPGRSAASGEPLAALTGLQMFSSIEFALWAASSIVRFWWIIARRVGRTPFRDWWFVLLGLAVVRALVGLTARDRGVGGLRISRPRLNIGGRVGSQICLWSGGAGC